MADAAKGVDAGILTDGSWRGKLGAAVERRLQTCDRQELGERGGHAALPRQRMLRDPPRHAVQVRCPLPHRCLRPQDVWRARRGVRR